MIRRERAAQIGGSAAPRRAAVLVLALFVLVLASSLAVLLMASSLQLVRTTRSEHESMLLRQGIDSAEAWLRANRSSSIETGPTLNVNRLLPEGASGEATVRLDPNEPSEVVIEVRLRFPDREVLRTARFPVHPPQTAR